MENKDWEPIGKALANVPLPSEDERFVRKVMAHVREEEDERRTSWIGLWKILALGLGLAAALLAVLTVVREPAEPIDAFLRDGIQDPMVAQWASQTEPTTDDVLKFTMED